ncbi:uncharacterized protein SPSK_00341 [Sporothrix schenckii 1099-18]|uniref:Uncharacterized protein n=1 Tax=Sporothrix schenckii 1099-18 TaxID=1397361 RepID=A0A0F2M2T9_SPOSC|nr:uncharacterized protein SPSK_00341 [Sporothrix schenckii 1099-18]KJR84023.1 hypothetical protein SPSK_00341 [Sporothrix schenckii 1099-18]
MGHPTRHATKCRRLSLASAKSDTALLGQIDKEATTYVVSVRCAGHVATSNIGQPPKAVRVDTLHHPGMPDGFFTRLRAGMILVPLYAPPMRNAAAGARCMRSPPMARRHEQWPWQHHVMFGMQGCVHGERWWDRLDGNRILVARQTTGL